MVLEDATPPSSDSGDWGDSFTSDDSLPSSSPDLYSGDRDPQILPTRESSYLAVSPGVYVNLQNLPVPFLHLNHPPAVRASFVEHCRQASTLLERPLHQEEADALTFHSARAIKIASYGSPLGLALGMLQFVRGWANGTNRFPGWTPNKEKYSPAKFGPLKGVPARVMWQALRFGVYGLVGTVLGSAFVRSYALSAGTAGMLVDSRLKELHEELRARAKQGKHENMLSGQTAGGREVDQTPGPRDGETYDMARQRRRVQIAGREWEATRRAEAVDEASPTGGMFMSGDQESGTANDSGVMSDGHVKQRDSQVRFEETKKEVQQSRNDGSGTAPKSSGSAWAKLRQQAGSRGPGHSSTSDSFMLSQAEEDKQLPRTEQQKQFDQRVEQERAGKDFESHTGGWRK